MSERFIDIPPDPRRSGSFAPSVLIDGVTYTPPGWMWLLAFARAGCMWAIQQINDDPRFQVQRFDVYGSFEDGAGI